MSPLALASPRSRRLAAVLLLALAAPAARGGEPARPDATAMGLRIYRDGVLPSGERLRATAQAGTPRTGLDAACAGCHRRSGYGASEGPIEIPPVTAAALFGWRELPPARVQAPEGLAPANPAVAASAARLAARTARIAAQTGPRRRPPYDEASLARALRDGVDVTGRPLGGGMPRYALSDEEVRALAAYLRTLSAAPSPGVTDEELHFATVVQPGVEPARRRGMLEVLRAFFRDKNAGTRSEAQRREAGTERMYRSYRSWVLHEWELTGPPEGWSAQLEAHYARQPVFALIGGLGSTSWRPIHEFSERRGVPCLFPQVELPVTDEEGFYTVYLSRGIALEAEALARYLQDRGGTRAVTQVFRREATSAAAAAAFRAALPAGAGIRVDDRALEGPPTPALWEELAGGDAGALVLWLPAADLAGADALGAARPVYLSSTLLAGAPSGLAAAGERARMIEPLELPRARAARLLRVKRWLQQKGIALGDEKVQTNAYFAASVTADAVTHMADLFSRDYLVERIEHLVGNTVAPSIYPRVSLGPGQRFASKGSYIVERGGRGEGELVAVSGWITP